MQHLAAETSTKKMHRAWSMYDWANSAYNLVITATIFPAYFIAVTGDSDPATLDKVSFFGWETVNSSMLNYALAFAYLLVAIISPILSSIVDYRGTKKRFMKIFTYLGGVACCGLFFFDAAHVEFALVLAMIGAIGYSGGIVMMLDDQAFAARLSFLLVGLWWIVFAQIPFSILPNGIPFKGDVKHSILTNGFHELRDVWQKLQHMPLLKIFLAAFFFFSMGVQTVMLAAAEFAVKEIKMKVDGIWVSLGTEQLIMIVVIIQLVAIVGAILMARLSSIIGNIRVLMLTVIVWIAVCFAAYYTQTANQFYFLAAIVGLVMGGIQSMSRSTYSKMMPQTKDTASFFGFYNVAEKLAMALGIFSFGLIEDITGSMRNSIFALAVFFLVGFILLYFTLRVSRQLQPQAT